MVATLWGFRSSFQTALLPSSSPKKVKNYAGFSIQSSQFFSAIPRTAVRGIRLPQILVLEGARDKRASSFQRFDPFKFPKQQPLRRFPGYISSAIEAPCAPTSLSSAEERQKLADAYGFSQIGEPVPQQITLKDVVDTLPPEIFEINEFKAWRNVVISVTSYALGLFVIAKAPWYLLPIAWAWTGTAITGFFVIGHDCAHKSFSKNKLVEDIVGTIAFMPLIYPYEPWRFKHDRHHAKTNMLGEDTAWHPVMREEWSSRPKFLKKAMEWGMGPLRPWASIGHWLIWHFDLSKYRPSERPRVKFSLVCVFAFIAIGWPLIIYKAGIIGWMKYWLVPWLGYHFWMSTFTMVHHTSPHIPFKDAKDWNMAQAQLGGTVHCDYPRWIEILCHDISVHIPHHLSQKIPSYNLRMAQDSLQNNWGKYLNKATWNWQLMKTIMTQCHIYDSEQNYVSFDHGSEDEPSIIRTLRRFMPPLKRYEESLWYQRAVGISRARFLLMTNSMSAYESISHS